jgi:hypothetical protein
MVAQPHSIALQYHTFVSQDIHSKDAELLYDSIGIDGTQLRVNRDGVYYNWADWFKNLHQVCDTALKYILNDTVAPVVITMKSKTYDPVTRKLTMTIDFKPYLNGRSDTIMYNVTIAENKLVRFQTHWDTCGKPFGHGGSYPSVHNDVVRTIYVQPYSGLLISGNWPVTQTITKDISMTVDTAWIPNNCNIVVYAYSQKYMILRSKILQSLKQSVTWPLGDDSPPSIEQTQIRIIPNPVRDYANAHLYFGEAGPAVVEILDITGRVVKDLGTTVLGTGWSNLEFSTSGLSAGQYLLLIRINGRSHTEGFSVKK